VFSFQLLTKALLKPSCYKKRKTGVLPHFQGKNLLIRESAVLSKEHGNNFRGRMLPSSATAKHPECLLGVAKGANFI